MKRNFTLTVDEKLLRAARKVAINRNTSVNQLVREYLERLVRESDRQRAALADIEEIFRTAKPRSGPITWSREELHERN